MLKHFDQCIPKFDMIKWINVYIFKFIVWKSLLKVLRDAYCLKWPLALKENNINPALVSVIIMFQNIVTFTPIVSVFKYAWKKTKGLVSSYLKVS